MTSHTKKTVVSCATSGSIVRALSRRSVLCLSIAIKSKMLTQKSRIAYVGPHGRKRYGRFSFYTPSHLHPLTSTCRKRVIGHRPPAWACEICARRFSVSSNLNRHARRCREKWAKADSLAAAAATDTPTPSPSSDPSQSPPSSASSDSPDSDRPPSPHLTDRPKRRQSAPGGLVQYETDDGSRTHDQRHVAGKPHRRRRKGSPSEPWVPASLVNFNLQSVTRSVLSTPLPAAVPSKFEERNSFADTPPQAYHPSWWTGSLVGPSYHPPPRSEEVSRGRFYGKLLVF